MATSSAAPDSASLTQLVRFDLTIDNMRSPDCLGWVRQQLAALGLLVDQVHQHGTEVAPTHIDEPDLGAIRAALAAGCYRLVAAASKVR